MTRRTKRAGIALAILLVVGALIWMFRTDRKRVNWTEHYEADSRDPYGTFVISQLLAGYFPGQPFHLLRDSLALPGDGQNASYVFVGEGILLDTLEIERLLDFVERGNRAFIASRTIPSDLADLLLGYIECEDDFYYWTDYYEIDDTAATFSLTGPVLTDTGTYRYRYRKGNNFPAYRWQYIDSTFLCRPDSGLVALGLLNDSLANFARLPWGDGFFYLHSAPIAFTNIQMLEEASVRYAERVFSHLPPGPVYWDEVSRISEALGRRRNRYSEPNFAERRLNTESPLQYVLGEPPLTWAWYLLLALALLYLIFRARRRQRIIPVLEPNTNTSLEFVATIGRLYFLQNDHQRLARQQMKLFQAYVREHYGLPARELNPEFVEKLAGKSEIPANRLRDLLEQYENINQAGRVNADALISFHQKLEYFYKHCK